MIRGSTPTHDFELPFGVGFIKSGTVTYTQNGKQVLRKKITECSLEGQTVSIKLTQEESLLFKCSQGDIYIQLKLLTQDNEVIYSEEESVSVKRCLDEEVLE